MYRDGDKNSMEKNGVGNVDIGRLGTPAFINVPEPAPLTEEEIKTVSLQVEQLNEEQVCHAGDFAQ